MTDYLEGTPDLDDPRVASAIDELSWWSSRFGTLLLDRVGLERDLRVLDLGCGTGFPLFELAHRLGASSRCVGVDVWEPALARARLKREVHASPNVFLVLADGARLPLQPGWCDLIVCNVGINNFDDPHGALAECARVSRRGARIVLTTNVEGHMLEFYAVFRRILGDLGLREALERLHANEAHRLSKRTIIELLEQAGFGLRRTVDDRFALRFLDGSALLRHPLTRLGFLDGWRAVVGPAREREVFAGVEAELNRLAELEGELRMTVPMLYLEAERE